MFIKYTKEMEYQDELWDDEKEDLEIMQRLQMEIAEAFQKIDKRVYFHFDIANGESLVTLYINITKEETLDPDFDYELYYDKTMKTSEDKCIQIVGNCKYLIRELEALLN